MKRIGSPCTGTGEGCPVALLEMNRIGWRCSLCVRKVEFAAGYRYAMRIVSDTSKLCAEHKLMDNVLARDEVRK